MCYLPQRLTFCGASRASQQQPAPELCLEAKPYVSHVPITKFSVEAAKPHKHFYYQATSFFKDGKRQLERFDKMSEYWKSTPKYLCKDCNAYVRDTKLERANHEATSRHQYARQRTLREMHNRHSREEREKERARREVERITGIVTGERPAGGFRSGAGGSGSGGAGGGLRGREERNDVKIGGITANATKEQRQAQLEQLAAMGVAIPEELRRDMAMAGEWTVTTTRVVKEAGDREDQKGTTSEGVKANEGIAVGMRGKKREVTDEEKETEEAVRGLFKKRKGGAWGRPGRDPFSERDGENELDGLLEGFGKGKSEEVEAKAENYVREEVEGEDGVKTEARREDGGEPKVKAEDADDNDGEKKVNLGDLPPVKNEAESAIDIGAAAAAEPEVPVVVFKKRKPKNMRQR
ncbi:hypothetical protein MKZ38_006969 [Zalerion maritima]|uniref:U1-type domain-containing protein n=1 Tax=Zalerion maritima TaxID=339359 RepID=A0AAD5WPE6_9PEZI|nr:hypothetical protein MKZ38_006969 [Zalerion maritima]